MPNMPRKENPARTLVVEDELWDAAKQIASERGERVSDVIRRTLQRLAQQQPPEEEPAPAGRARGVRVEDELWHAAQDSAAARGESVSEVVRRALQRYVRRNAA